MPSVHACVHLSHFKIKLYNSFSYEDITKFAENVYGCENMSVKNYGTPFIEQRSWPPQPIAKKSLMCYKT